MKLSKAQLSKVLESVTDDLAAIIKHEETEDTALSKADPGEEAPGEKTPEGSSSEESPEGGDEGAPPAPEASAEGEGGGEPDGDEGGAPAPEAAPEASADPAADTSPMSPEALEAEYAQLSPEEMKMHLLALQSAFMKVAGGGAGPDASAPAAPGPEASAPPAAPAPAGPPPAMGKGELKSAGNGGKVSAGKMSKSEDGDVLVKMEQLSSKVEELSKALSEKDATIAKMEESFGSLAEGFKNIILKQGAMRKSVTGVSFVGKPGDTAPAAGSVDISTMSKAEINEKLNAVIRSSATKLSKSDRETIQKFVAGNGTAESVAKFITVG